MVKIAEQNYYFSSCNSVMSSSLQAVIQTQRQVFRWIGKDRLH